LQCYCGVATVVGAQHDPESPAGGEMGGQFLGGGVTGLLNDGDRSILQIQSDRITK